MRKVVLMILQEDDISVVIPLYNEASVVEELYARLSRSLTAITLHYEILFVNDGSDDVSLERIKAIAIQDQKVKYIGFTRNFGHQAALMAGLNYCSGKAVVIMDGDLQDPPELIPALYKKYREGYKVVTAKRNTRAGEGIFKRLTAKYFYRIFSRITNFYMPLDTGDFRIIDRCVVEALTKMSERNVFIRGQIAWLGYKQTYVLFDRNERQQGKTAYSFRKMVRFALDGITSFSNFPLKLATVTGFVISAVAFLIILYALYAWMVLDRTVSGWTSIIISSMFIGGAQLICIGIIGEYLGRMNIDIKERPFYVIEEGNVNTDSFEIQEENTKLTAS